MRKQLVIDWFCQHSSRFFFTNESKIVENEFIYFSIIN